MARNSGNRRERRIAEAMARTVAEIKEKAARRKPAGAGQVISPYFRGMKPAGAAGKGGRDGGERR